MVIDTSALIAILQNEPETQRLIHAIDLADTRLMSTVSMVEASIVRTGQHGSGGTRDLDIFVERAQIELVAVDEQLARAARDAFVTFGKGRHAAGLNFGDCFSYALAHTRGRPLLFKGGDLAKTDIEAVPY